jgi:glutamate dehydrogenase
MHTPKLSLFTKEQIELIRQSLHSDEVSLLSRIRIPGCSHDGTSIEAFLDALFSRSAPDIPAKISAEKVVEIIRGTCHALSNIESSPDKIVINQSSTPVDALFIALKDCPFIISTIAERLSDTGIKVRMFLHPVVVVDGMARAFSYIEFDDDVDTYPQLADSIRESLIALTQIVADFDSMTKQVENFSARIPADTIESDSGTIDSSEIQNLLNWLCDGAFFLLGTRLQSQQSSELPLTPLGLWKLKSPHLLQVHREALDDIERVTQSNTTLDIRKLRTTSIVHRRTTYLHIIVKNKSDGTFLSLLGYLTSKAWTSESQDIPLLRQKVSEVLQKEAVVPNSHDYKYIVEIVDNMPTDEALCCTNQQLQSIIQLSLGLFSREITRSTTYIDPLKRRALTTVVLPPERYSASVRMQMQRKIEDVLGSEHGSSELHLDSSKRRQFRLYVSTPLSLDFEVPLALENLSNALADITQTWEERLFALTESERFDPLEWFTDFSFPADYKAATPAVDAAKDIASFEDFVGKDSVGITLTKGSQHGPDPIITVLSENPDISISKAIPVLENIGLEVRRARSYALATTKTTIHILKLTVQAHDGQELNSDMFKKSIGPGLSTVLAGKAHNDALNSLLRSASLSIREISLLRTYCALLWQVNKFTTKRTMWESLAHAPQAALQLWKIFEISFNPEQSLSLSERKTLAEKEESLFVDELRKIPDITQDRVLKALLSLLKATVRTNFFTDTDSIAVKIRSSDVEVIPQPKPLFEIFVFSSRIEGTHLRSSKVARGGIRWSERLDDYRSEVLGLMKTQKIKNVIIVPSGAKGGFIVKTTSKDPHATPAAVETAYREYISALLTLADNNVNGTIRHPESVIVHDDADPYFVVAADKGTASFSDIANSIAQKKFGFWLEDAFASGGSAGYDHKKYGITARGGWECVVRHFKDLSIDYERSPFTVVGIGDMSGDVFGNGLLLSRQMKLLAAFNHKHIFIDPNPNPSLSFDERKRLFELPRSQWSDYSKDLISVGGGVFGRFDKEIRLTPEIRAALGIEANIPENVDGEQLISLVLKAPADLLWNGGIGTYVKSASESNSDVNDGTNDRVRINSTELRVKVVGEGGNLGFTQRARVEYSELGGRINTDAIDNSGGVDLSDHEVNLKLLLNPIYLAGGMSLEERNALLKDIDSDVVDAVLSHNRDQAWMLTVSREQSRRGIEAFRGLIRDMHRRGYLDRNRDELPDEVEFDDRAIAKTGLYRPELAICSAATKMWIKDGLRDSELCLDPNLEYLLYGYFPKRIQMELSSAVASHSLRKDIIANEIVNSLLPAVGISFVHTMASIHGATIPSVMKAILAADRILNGERIRKEILSLDKVGSSRSILTLWEDAGTALREASGWLLNYHAKTHTLSQIIELYSEPFDTLIEHADEIFTGQEFIRYERRISQYKDLGVSLESATSFSVYRRILPILEVLWAARQFKFEERQVATTYSQVLEDLGINEVLKFESILDASNHWEQELIVGSYQEIRRSISLITGQVLSKNVTSSEQVKQILSSGQGYDSIRNTMSELEELGRQKRPFQVAVLPVIARQLRLFRI